MGFTTELNLLGIVGKRLAVEKARVVEKKLEVGKFNIVPDQKWDSQVAPNLCTIEQDGSVDALHKNF